jgi:hypothetical protein
MESTQLALASLIEGLKKEPLSTNFSQQDIAESWETFFFEFSCDFNDETGRSTISYMDGEWLWDKLIPRLVDYGLDQLFGTLDFSGCDGIEAFSLRSGKLVRAYKPGKDTAFDEKLANADDQHKVLRLQCGNIS